MKGSQLFAHDEIRRKSWFLYSKKTDILREVVDWCHEEMKRWMRYIVHCRTGSDCQSGEFSSFVRLPTSFVVLVHLLNAHHVIRGTCRVEQSVLCSWTIRGRKMMPVICQLEITHFYQFAWYVYLLIVSVVQCLLVENRGKAIKNGREIRPCVWEGA